MSQGGKLAEAAVVGKMSYIFIIDKSKEVIFVTLDMLENEGQL